MTSGEQRIKSLETILLSDKKVRDFRRLFYELTGMVTAFYFEGWDKGGIDYFPPRAKCDFCRIIQSSPCGREMCIESDRQSYELVKREKKPTFWRCFAGNSAIGIPIIAGERFIGVVFCGDVHRCPPTGTGFARLKKHLQRQGLQVDMASLEQAYMSIPVVNRRESRLAVELLSLIVNYIVEREETYRLQETIYQRQKEISDYALTRLSLEKDLRRKAKEVDLLRKQLQAGIGAEVSAGLATEDLSIRRRIVDSAVEYIDRYYMEKITLADIAGHLGVSSNYLCTIFRCEQGCGFPDYLCRRRIKAACELLKDIRVNVSEVALRTGFQDVSYFSSRFKSIVGLPPSEYRRRLIEAAKS
ncbi:MAG: PocR ligand-binding domain-containing protein [bacterium]|nr:PocR ligand-binding domain-containing protein [bacterium]